MTSKADAVRWGVIGLGYFGEVHAHTLSSMPGIFANCIRSGSAPDRCPPEASRAAVELMLAATKSAESGEVVWLRPPRRT